jgi:hypothetical protein
MDGQPGVIAAEGFRDINLPGFFLSIKIKVSYFGPGAQVGKAARNSGIFLEPGQSQVVIGENMLAEEARRFLLLLRWFRDLDIGHQARHMSRANHCYLPYWGTGYQPGPGIGEPLFFCRGNQEYFFLVEEPIPHAMRTGKPVSPQKAILSFFESDLAFPSNNQEGFFWIIKNRDIIIQKHFLYQRCSN